MATDSKITVHWDKLVREILGYDHKHPKKVSYPKGSVEEAIQQALNIMGGRDEARLGERGSK